MRKLSIFLLFALFACKREFKIDDSSLKINVSTANDACSCNDIAIAIMREEITILSEVKKQGKSTTDPKLNEELKKRNAKHYEYYNHCKPIYEVEGMGSKCANYKEAEELDKEGSKLRRELGME